jgi:VanZ family protein
MLRHKVMKLSHLLALYLFWPAVLVVLWGELDPHPELEQEFWDKSLHFMAYFGLAGLGTVALNAGRRAAWAVLGLIAFGGFLEIVQGVIGRDMSLYDELANALGALGGGMSGWLLMRALGHKAG